MSFEGRRRRLQLQEAETEDLKVADELLDHTMYSKTDYDYFIAKGYLPSEILVIWDRDAGDGCSPAIHEPAPDIVGFLSKQLI